jgi:hypothetical protein
MDTVSTIVALLKELGTPAITVIGFGWVIFKLNKLEAKVSALAVDMRSIKNNHLPHIEAAMMELAKGLALSLFSKPSHNTSFPGISKARKRQALSPQQPPDTGTIARKP